ncbi:MAG: surface-adhesin E family protein [Burkholderiales bacterium]|jgi:hypothetical protein
MSTRSLLLAFSLLLSGPALANTEWINPRPGNNGDTYYVRLGSFEIVSTDVARAWILRNLGSPAHGVSSNVVLWEFNCTTKQRRFVQVSHYSEPMGKGKVVFREGASAWNRVEPGSVGDRLLQGFCG